MEVVEGIKEGYESDALDPEGPLEGPSTKSQKAGAPASDEEIASKKGTGESDEDFNINLHKGYGDLELEEESTSIR